MDQPLHCCVVGAGIVGACCALELLARGHRVTLLDPGPPGGEQAASFGNGAWISPASVVPMSMPGLWKKVPGYLLDREGPLTIRWDALPALAPWLWRFVRAGATVPRVQATARALSALLHDAPQRHQALAGLAGHPELIQRKGLLYVYPARADFESEAMAWSLRRDNGVRWQELDRVQLQGLVPALAPNYAFAALVPEGAHCRDPGAYVAALVNHALAQGAQWRALAATGFEFSAGRLRGVRTADGLVACDRAVLAAGIASAELAARAGDRVPLHSERGYHVMLQQPGFDLEVPLMPSDGKMAITSLDGGLRLAGQVELARVDAAPDWRRTDILLRHARKTFAGLSQTTFDAGVSRWMGHRPSTPDGLPVIGPARASADLIYAFGHGHVGLASAPATAQLVADLLAPAPPRIDAAPYSATRHRRSARGAP